MSKVSSATIRKAIAIHPFNVSFGVLAMNDKEILNLLKTEFRRKIHLSTRKSETLAGSDAEKRGKQNQPARKNDPLFVLRDGPDQ
jgi:hypothetical protein